MDICEDVCKIEASWRRPDTEPHYHCQDGSQTLAFWCGTPSLILPKYLFLPQYWFQHSQNHYGNFQSFLISISSLCSVFLSVLYLLSRHSSKGQDSNGNSNKQRKKWLIIFLCAENKILMKLNWKKEINFCLLCWKFSHPLTTSSTTLRLSYSKHSKFYLWKSLFVC